jgi:FMN-dependent oxidoreductase (nitrilotriacetate monooxygenase family)
MSKRMHLNAFMMYTPMIHAIHSWGLPQNRIREGFNDPDFWQEIAQTLERGRFDTAFFADHLAPYDVYEGDATIALRRGLQFPVHDPVVLIPWMAAATQHLGFGVTLSTASYPPYLLVRKMSTLDHLTRGRMAWNVVTSFQASEARNLGVGRILAHDERYEHADEYLDVCKRLWESWDEDALVWDVARHELIDVTKLHPVKHSGRYFEIDAVSTVSRSPQGRPVIMQAGGSPRGRDFAAEHADVMFAIKRQADDMAEFVGDMESRAAAFARSREDFQVIFGVQLVLGRSDAEAQELRAQLFGLVDLESSLAKLSGVIGVDLSDSDPDSPMADLRVPGAQGILDAFTKTSGSAMTLREVAVEYGVCTGMPQIVGGPESVADQLEALHVDGRGDGFNISPIDLPRSFDLFADTVTPILQRRGIVPVDYTAGTLREKLFQP